MSISSWIIGIVLVVAVVGTGYGAFGPKSKEEQAHENKHRHWVCPPGTIKVNRLNDLDSYTYPGCITGTPAKEVWE